MAIYSCSLASIGRTTHAAGTAGAHLRYIARDEAEPVVQANGMPLDAIEARAWMDREEANARANARLIDKVRLAIPRELSRDERLSLVGDFVRGITGDRVPWMFAIHQEGDDAQNPHAHVVICDRHMETGKRLLRLSDSPRDRQKAGLEPKAVEWIRERWEHFANNALARAGHEQRIDRRTLAAQGIDREPTIHLGPRAQYIDRFVERPRSKRRVNALGREVDYVSIDQGRTRQERNAEIIDLNLERLGRSPDLETRAVARFEKAQRVLDTRLEQSLAQEARVRTRAERELKASFRAKLKQLGDERRAVYVASVAKQNAALAPARTAMTARHADDRAAIHQAQTSFWSRLCRAVDITGGTRRRHQAESRALSAQHRMDRATLAQEQRAAWIELKDAAARQFAPREDRVRSQAQKVLAGLRETHDRADALADSQRQRRESDREQERSVLIARLNTVKNASVGRPGNSATLERSSNTRSHFQERADRAFEQGQDKGQPGGADRLYRPRSDR